MQNLLYQIIKVVVKGYHVRMGIYNIVNDGIKFRHGVFTVILTMRRAVSVRQVTKFSHINLARASENLHHFY